MDNLDFLQHVLGNDGYYCIVGLKKGSDRPIQKFFQRLEDAASVARNLAEEEYDAYYALATFEDGKSRKTANVKQLRSLFLDLDCGEGKPYETQSVAFNALKTFCRNTGMPRPTVVNSGGGVHVYWALAEPITAEQWLPLATKLKQLCDEHDLDADPVVTADAVRILRVPGTLNYKLDTARPVKVFKDDLAPAHTYEDLKEILGEPIVLRKSYIPRGEPDEVTKNILGNYSNRFKTILLKTLKGQGCQQIRHILENQHNLSEPMWRAGLSIAKFCVDAETAIERISSKHPNYSVEATDRKVHGIKGGPYLCDRFSEYNPGGCDGCPNKGLVKSPIVLGREVLEATDEDNIIQDTPEIDKNNTQIYVIPKYPDPYFRGKVRGIFKRSFQVSKDDDPEDVKETMIYPYDMYVTRRLLDAEVGEAIVVRLHLPKDGVREFTIPLTSVSSKDELRKELSKRGVALAKFDDLMYYMMTWVTTMQQTGRADTARRQFGWVDDKFEAFVLGDREISKDRIDYNPPSAATAQLIPAFDPKGDLDTWKSVMEFYNRPDMQLHQFMIGACFGSIFTKFTPIFGAILHVYSPDSGIGKTTAYQAGMSMWGDPSKLITKDDDTKNSKFNRAEILNNVALCIDELTNADAKTCSELAYTFTSGQQRNRMSGSSNLERHRGNPWNTLALTNGNSSMIEKMSAYKALPKGEAMRVLEFRATAVAGLDKQVTDSLSNKILNNYGLAATPYLQYIMNDVENIKELYKSTQKRLDELCGFGPADRFHSVIVTDAIMGLIIAKKAGLINFDIQNVVKWIAAAMKRIKANYEGLDMDAEGVITDYITENWRNILRIRSTEDARSEKDMLDHIVVPDQSPQFQLIARLEYDIARYFFYLAPLKAWCVKRQINYEGLIDALKSGRARGRIEKKRMGKGTRVTLAATSVLVIDAAAFNDDIEKSIPVLSASAA